jgi:hypothetical protein
MKRLYIIIFTFLILSCSTESVRENTSEIEVINIQIDQIPKLSDFVDNIDYYILPKEVSAGFFDKILVTENNFIFADYDMSRKIFVLDKQFNLISTISKYGEGPGEYQRVMAVDFNKELETIEILTNKNIIRYSTDGKYIESVKIPFPFGSFIHVSEDKYLIYNKYQPASPTEINYLFALWNSKTNKFIPIVNHERNELAGSFMERSNMYRFNNEIFVSHIFLDTLYKVGVNNEITKYFLNFDNKNLPYKYVKFDSKEGHQSILDNEEFMKNYAFHYPTLLVTDHYLIDGYIKNNIINFFILNRIKESVVSGNKFKNDIDSGINYLHPRFIDSSNNLYTFHQYEELKELALNYTQEATYFHKFVNGIDSETGFVVIKYRLKDF